MSTTLRRGKMTDHDAIAAADLKTSYNRDELIACGEKRLREGLPPLPRGEMLMFDRITNISISGGSSPQCKAGDVSRRDQEAAQRRRQETVDRFRRWLRLLRRRGDLHGRGTQGRRLSEVVGQTENRLQSGRP